MLAPSGLGGLVERALALSAVDVRRSGAIWQAAVHGAGPMRLQVRVAESGWIDATVSGRKWAERQFEEQPWMLLRHNAALRGGVRIGCGRDGGVEVRADLHAGIEHDDGGTDESEVSECLAALFGDVAATCRASTARSERPADGPPDAVDEKDSAALAQLCAEAGWPGAQRETAGVSLWLAAGAANVHATLTRSVCGRLNAVVPFAAPIVAEVSRTAVAVLLLRLSSSNRAVKGVAIPGSDDRPGIALAWARPVRSAAALDRALSALAVACARASREVDALRDESLARDYLRVTMPGRSGAGIDSPARIA